MHKRLITIFATLLCVAACAFGLAACNNTVAVESVTLDKTAVTLQVGGEETLTATVTPDIATDKAVTWSSDNTAVATVANGKVTAVSAGTATVTTTADGKYTASSLDKTETMNAVLTDVEVVFENERLVGIKFVADDGSHTIAYEIYDFDETWVTLPEDYTDNTAGA